MAGRGRWLFRPLSHRAAGRLPWVRFLPPLSEPGGPISGGGVLVTVHRGKTNQEGETRARRRTDVMLAGQLEDGGGSMTWVSGRSLPSSGSRSKQRRIAVGKAFGGERKPRYQADGVASQGPRRLPRPRITAPRPLEGPDRLADGAALPPAALALGVRHAHRATMRRYITCPRPRSAMLEEVGGLSPGPGRMPPDRQKVRFFSEVKGGPTQPCPRHHMTARWAAWSRAFRR